MCKIKNDETLIIPKQTQSGVGGGGGGQVYNLSHTPIQATFMRLGTAAAAPIANSERMTNYFTSTAALSDTPVCPPTKL